MVLDDLFRRPSALARFRDPPLGPHMDGFCGWLQPQGFSRWTLRHRIWQTSHFNQCLRKWSVKACHEVSPAYGERFLRRHLPHCRCRGGLRCGRAGAHGAVHSLIEYLSQRGLLAEPPPPDTTYHEVLQRYLEYLRDERHLSKSTVKSHRVCLVPFHESFGTPLATQLQRLSPEQLLAYFTQYSQTSAPSMSRCLQGVLRRFCRFCLLHGYLERDQEAAIPPAASLSPRRSASGYRRRGGTQDPAVYRPHHRRRPPGFRPHLNAAHLWRARWAAARADGRTRPDPPPG